VADQVSERQLPGPRRAGPQEPVVGDDIQIGELDRAARTELRGLSKVNAEFVGRHLVAATRALNDDPELAYAHAMAAQRRAGRIAVVRELTGVAAYHAGLWSQALAELRAARRMSGSSHQLPLMADAERGLGRPERALELAASPEAATLTAAERVELTIVCSGARGDLGQVDAAVVALQIPELTAVKPAPYTARLRYAHAEALVSAGRTDEAVRWFAQAAECDPQAETDAEERLAQLQGLVFTDIEETDIEKADRDDTDSTQSESRRVGK
jgi:tetratricopeptide (TPR) repeat protein